jgi:hypothetical protein
MTYAVFGGHDQRNDAGAVIPKTAGETCKGFSRCQDFLFFGIQANFVLFLPSPLYAQDTGHCGIITGTCGGPHANSFFYTRARPVRVGAKIGVKLFMKFQISIRKKRIGYSIGGKGNTFYRNGSVNLAEIFCGV